MWRSAVQVCQGLHFAARQCAPGASLPGTTLRRKAMCNLREHLLCKQGVNGSNPLFSTLSPLRGVRSLTCWNRREKLSRFLTHSRKRAIPRYAPRIIRVAGQAKAGKGARRMPVAREGRRKRPLIRRCPNGATRQSDGLSSTLWWRRTWGTETS